MTAGIDISERALNRRRRDRQFVLSAASSLICKPLTIAFSLFSLAACSWALTPSEFGVATTIAALSGLLSFADFGFGNSLMSRLAPALGSGNTRIAQTAVSSGVAALISIGLLCASFALISLAIVPWSSLLGISNSPVDGVTPALLAFLLARAAAVPGAVGQRIHMAAEQGNRSNLWGLAGAAVSCGSCVIASQLTHQLWIFVACISIVPTLFNFAETCSVFVLEMPELRPRWSHVDGRTLIRLGRLGGLFFVLSAAGAVAFQSDTLVAAAVLGAANAGVFAVAVRLFTAVSTLVAGMSSQMWPAITAARAGGDVTWIKSRFKIVIYSTLIAASTLNLVLVLVGQSIVRMWLGPEQVPPMSLLIAAALWSTYSAVMAQVALLLNAYEAIAQQIAMCILMAVANVGISILLTHRLGLAGPLLGSIVAHVVFNGIPAVWLARRVLRSDQSVMPTQRLGVDIG